MADSLLDIGGEPIFEFDPAWNESPRTNLDITRYLLSYRGTATRISEKNEEVPIIVTAQFIINDREDEYNFIDFIHNQIGRVERFWFKYPKTIFEIKEDIPNGSSLVKVHLDNSDLSWNGYERIFIEMDDGDLITRHVESTTLDEANEEVEFQLATASDRNIALGDISRTGRLLLVRFDNDDFKFAYETDRPFVTITQRFYEVVKDYSDLAANP